MFFQNLVDYNFVNWFTEYFTGQVINPKNAFFFNLLYVNVKISKHEYIVISLVFFSHLLTECYVTKTQIYIMTSLVFFYPFTEPICDFTYIAFKRFQ